MATELAQRQNFTSEETELIRSTVAVGATDNELKLFLYQARRTGLDPLARQIYFVKRGETVTIQTSIDGFRIIAERSGRYAGQDEPKFEKMQGFRGGEDIKCTVQVYKWSPTNERYKATVGVAFWSEYCPITGKDFMWKKMPRTMLAKVAEALALRKAFPQDLSGVYSLDEMDQASKPEEHNELTAIKILDAKKEKKEEQETEDGLETPFITDDELEELFNK